MATLATALSALSNDRRLQIIEFLIQHSSEPVSVATLTQELCMPQSTVSRHIQCLSKAGLVANIGRRRGYKARQDNFDLVLQQLSSFYMQKTSTL